MGFVPDICNILCKYRMPTFINDILTDSATLPPKQACKTIVKRMVLSNETQQWQQRIFSDDDFQFFRILHTTITPAIPYKVFSESRSKHIMRFIANLWTKSPDTELTICEWCNSTYRDRITHFIAECASTAHLRWKLVCCISNSSE